MLVEGMRPGAIERLGLGPDECLARNPRLVYGRMTGWGQDGPLAHDGRARHELHRHHRRPPRPRPGPRPAALPDQPGRRLRRRLDVPRDRHPRRPARGPDQRAGAGRRRRDRRRHRAPQRDGARPWPPVGLQPARARSGLLDGGTPVLRRLRDLRRPAPVSVGALEPQFYDELVRLLELDLPDRNDPANLAGDARARSPPGSASGPRPSGPSSSRAPTPASPAIIPLSEAAAAPAPRGARHVRRARRAHPAGPGAALLADRRQTLGLPPALPGAHTVRRCPWGIRRGRLVDAASAGHR